MMIREFLKRTFVRKIYDWYMRTKHAYIEKVKVPPYREKRAILLSYKKQYSLNTLIETGTFLGDTIEQFRNDFDQLISFELSKELAEKAAKRFSSYDHIRIINADSGKLLGSVLKDIQQPCLFWLDGHYSSEFFVGEDFIKTAKGEKDTPIVEELSAIFSHGIQKHVILIDDARCFTGNNDYPSMKELKRIVQQLNPATKVTVKRDIIRIEPL